MCLNKHKGRSDYKEFTEKSRKLKGCYGEVSHIVSKDEDIEFKTCPGNFTNSSVYYYYELFQYYQKGIMPFSGTITEQPYKLSEIFGILQKFDLDRLEKQAKRAKDGKRKNHGRGNS